MSRSSQTLFSQLPALLRVRDAEAQVVTPALLPAAERDEYNRLQAMVDAGQPLTLAEDERLALLSEAALAGPLESLLAVFDEQLRVMEEDLEQSYDNLFIETCAPWVVPYIGDLVGYRALRSGAQDELGSPRAEVAHTIALRRRKGTAVVLEQLARDVTGWHSRAVEFFQTLGTTQYMNHVRPRNLYSPDLRRWRALERIDTAFDSASRTVDVRRIASGRGRHNIPNVGIFVWPIAARSATRSRAVRVDARRYVMSPLGHDASIYVSPLREESITHLAEPVNVPMPLSRRALDADLRAPRQDFYGEGLSLAIYLNGSLVPVPAARVRSCDLTDAGVSWGHLPNDDVVAVDAVRGRIGLPAAPAVPVTRIDVTYHYGFSAEMGGGEYERAASFAELPGQVVLRVPGDHLTIQAALDALGGDGVVVVTDNARYEETLTVHVAAGKRVELRSANERRPSLALSGPFTITGDAASEFSVNGLLVSGRELVVPAQPGNVLGKLHLAHVTLVPGRGLTADGQPAQPGQPSLVIGIPATSVVVAGSIVGGVRAHERSRVQATDSIIDATSHELVACAGVDGVSVGPSLSLDGCTVIGKVHAQQMPRVSNSLLLASLASGDAWPVAVHVQQKQAGCVRFSWLPVGSRVPRRHRCLPRDDGLPAPRMVSVRYGTPAYGRLSPTCDAAIRRGADDEDEMGAFHHVLASTREGNLQLRLAEYLRAGLESGIIHEIDRGMP